MIAIYIVCHDDNSEAIAKQIYGSRSWARVIRIKSTHYLESIMYHELLEQRHHEWKNAEWVGTLSWRAHEKITVPDFDHLGDGLSNQPEKPDVVSFYYGNKGSMLECAEKSHPGFTQLWCHLLEALGYTSDTILSKEIPPIYGNYWMTRPCWMEKYIAFAKRTRHAMETLPGIQSKLWSDSGYPRSVSKIRMLSIFNRNYYTFHPFLFERLPGFFFWTEGAVLDYARIIS